MVYHGGCELRDRGIGNGVTHAVWASLPLQRPRP